METKMESNTAEQKSAEQQTVEQLIKEDMTIGDIISKYPSTIEVLLRNGVHCVGCGAKTFEKLGDGLRGHGFSAEKVAQIMKVPRGK